MANSPRDAIAPPEQPYPAKIAEAVFTHNVSALVVLDSNYNFVRVNPAYARACRRDVNDFPGRNHFDLYPSDAKGIFDDVVQSKRPFATSARPFVFVDQPERGTTYWDWTLTPVLDAVGEVEYLIFSLMDVTERALAEEALRASEAQSRQQAAELQLIYRTAPIGLCVVDRALRYIHVNDWLADANGVPAALHFGHTVREVLPGLAELVELKLARVIETGEPVRNFEFTVDTRRDPGKPHVWLNQYWPIMGDDRTVLGVNVVVEDVTELRHLEEVARREEMFRNLAENSTDIIARFDRALRRIYVNPAIEAFVDRPRAELIGKTHHDIGIPPSLADELDRKLMETFASGQPRVVEAALPTGKGERYLESRLVPEFGSDGTVATVLAITRDLTERKHAEEAIRRQADQYAAVLATTADGFWRSALDGRLLEVNDAYCRMSGYTRDELLRMTIPDVEAVETPEEIHRHSERIITKGFDRFESRHRRKDGSEWDVDLSVVCWQSQFLVFARDITQLKAAQNALRESEGRFRQLAEALPQVVWTCSADGLCDYLNPRWEEYTGSPAAQNLGEGWIDFIHPDDRHRLLSEWGRAVARNDAFRGEYRLRRKDGAYRWFDTRAAPVRSLNGNVVKWVGSDTDIEDRKRAEEKSLRLASDLGRALDELKASQQQTIQSEKMAALGTMAAGLAHELSNPLMGIMNYVAYARDIAAVPELQAVLDRVGSELRRMRDLLKSLLMFARPIEELTEEFEVAEVVERTLDLTASQWKNLGITVETDIAAGLPPVIGKPGGLQQVLLNLLMNARDAVKAVAEKRIWVSAKRRGDTVRIQIGDTGQGIPEPIKEKVFDPFFTTKAPGEGTGLGLSVSRTIVADMGGTIDFVSDEGNGAVFTLTFPLVAARANRLRRRTENGSGEGFG